MRSPIGFRVYQEGDLDGVLALCRQEGWISYADDRDRARKVFTAPGVVAVVATTSSHIIGFAYFQTDRAIQAHLSLLVVEQTYRRLGAAKGIISYAFPLLGATRVDLITDTAEAFYRSLSHKEESGFRLYPPGTSVSDS
ncbi:GNAT family N-acetyltransferase [Ferrimicrobium acidiphilum]|uniref:GNAT family N-acetyltransferase n=1 Tax=Ferrimicrobium acidiphilum TaxID=121039 RepID=UPI0023F25E2E|nr:GNAT family N-acetyltransferase [Ferrimicrobium acidiphilum]